MSFIRFKTVTTKKDHKCFGCLDTIPKGTKAQYFSGVTEGDFTYGYLCDVCDDCSRKLRYDDDIWYEGELKELYPYEWEESYEKLKKQAEILHGEFYRCTKK